MVFVIESDGGPKPRPPVDGHHPGHDHGHDHGNDKVIRRAHQKQW